MPPSERGISLAQAGGGAVAIRDSSAESTAVAKGGKSPPKVRIVWGGYCREAIDPPALPCYSEGSVSFSFSRRVLWSDQSLLFCRPGLFVVDGKGLHVFVCCFPPTPSHIFSFQGVCVFCCAC